MAAAAVTWHVLPQHAREAGRGPLCSDKLEDNEASARRPPIAQREAPRQGGSPSGRGQRAERRAVRQRGGPRGRPAARTPGLSADSGLGPCLRRTSAALADGDAASPVTLALVLTRPSAACGCCDVHRNAQARRALTLEEAANGALPRRARGGDRDPEPPLCEWGGLRAISAPPLISLPLVTSDSAAHVPESSSHLGDV